MEINFLNIFQERNTLGIPNFGKKEYTEISILLKILIWLLLKYQVFIICYFKYSKHVFINIQNDWLLLKPLEYNVSIAGKQIFLFKQ